MERRDYVNSPSGNPGGYGQPIMPPGGGPMAYPPPLPMAPARPEESDDIIIKANVKGQKVVVQPGQVVVLKESENLPGLSDDLLVLKKDEPKNALEYLSSDNLEAKARLNFIKKVYLILLIQLGITFGICFLSYYSPGFYRFQLDNFWILYLALGLLVVLFVLIQCVDSVGRKFPINLIALFFLTLFFSYIISVCTSAYAEQHGGMLVLQAVAITMLVVVGLIFYALLTPTDFTTFGGIIVTVVICFAFFGIFASFSWNPIVYSLYCTLGAIFAGILLIIDTQVIVGGDRQIQISMDDYVLGALILYVDIIRLFLYILGAMGASKSN